MSADLIVITPTRGRPAAFRRLVAAVRATTQGRVPVLGLIDTDDPARHAYLSDWPEGAELLCGDRRTLAGWTNFAASFVLGGSDPPRYLASLGDDHLPRSADWDLTLIEAIEALPGPGFAYPNDLLQGERLPTAWVVSADVVRTVGWMMLPACAHLFVDTAVLELGRTTDRIVYLPGVIVEHVHPMAGKTAWDDSYRETNGRDRYTADRAAFDAWRNAPRFDADTAAVAALTWERAPCPG